MPDPKREIRIQRVPLNDMTNLANIKAHTGKSMANFVKDNIASIIESYYREFPHHRMQE